MFKKFIVSIAFGLLGFAAHANTILSGFYMDAVDENVGGFSTIHWDDGSLTWANHFAVYVTPSASIIGSVDPDYTIIDWISPVVNGGATFQPVELFARWGQNNEVFATSMGNGVDLTFNHWNVLAFSNDQASWDVTLTPVTSVPEPQSYALMLAGLGLMMVIMKKAKSSNLSHSGVSEKGAIIFSELHQKSLCLQRDFN